MNVNSQRQASSLLILGTLVSLSFVAIPLIYLFRRATTGDSASITAVLLRTKTLEVFSTTISLTLIVALLATVSGVALAWIIHNIKLPLLNFLRALIILPIAIPSYVFTFSWISLFPSFQGYWAAVFVLYLSTTPYVTLAALAALRRVDWSQHEVAQTLGLNAAATFFKVTLPQIRNSIAAGSLLVALYVLSDFGAVSLLGVDTFTRSIANLYRGSFDRSTAAVLALILVLISAVIIGIEGKTRSRSTLMKSSSKIIANPQSIKTVKARVISLIVTITYIALGLAIPLSLLIARFVANTSIVNYSNLVRAALSTIVAASLGALIALVLALPLGILVQQGSTLARFADKGVLIVHALPGIVMGLALVAFGSEFPWLYQTLTLLAFAYALLFMAKSVGAVRTSLSRVPQNLIDISSTLGQSRSQTIRRVVIPLSAPGILSGTLLVFLAAMKELPATLMLRPTGFETLATEMWTYTSISRLSEAAPYALLLVLVAAIPTFLITRPDKSDSGEGDLA